MTTKPITVDFKGPIFKTEAGKAVRRAINKTISKVATRARQETRKQLSKGHGVDSGAFKKGIRSKKRGLTSRTFALDARKAAWLSGTSKLNARSRFKGLSPRPFRAAAQITDQTAGEEARKIVADLVRELGG